MLNLPFVVLPALAEGKKLWPWLSDITKVSAATLKNPNIKDSTVKRAIATATKQAEDQLTNNKFTPEEIEKWLADAPKEGICSALVYGCQIDGLLAYPHTIEFARQIDLLSSRLLNLLENNDLNGFKSAILDSFVRDPAYFSSNAALCEQHIGLSHYERFKSAKDWHEIREPYLQLMFNTTLSLLAQWDVEFGSQYFKSFEPCSCFAMLLTKLDPKAGSVNDGKVSKRRDMYWKPVRRLIDLMACLGENCRKAHWPTSIPKVKAIDVVTNEGQEKITQWRRGHHNFTHRDFIRLWNNLCPVRETSVAIEYRPEPLPLFFASLLWQEMLVSEDKFILLNDDASLTADCYSPWWQRHYESLKAKGYTFGTLPWPACFSKL